MAPLRPEELTERVEKAFELIAKEKIVIVYIVASRENDEGDCIGGYGDLLKLDKGGVIDSWFEKHDYNLVVIGGGSGGLAAAKEAARLGQEVICLDFVKPSTMGATWGLGGTCVNVGCIPKKLMHQAALLGGSIEDARKFGWSIPSEKAELDWSKLVKGVQDHICSLNWKYKVQLRENSVKYLNAYGSFVGPHKVSVVDKKGKVEIITGDRFLIATGLRPRFPDIPGARECCITSDDLFSLSYNPGKTLCVGASYVSLECAGFLEGFGNDVTVMVRSILLRGFDQDMAERIRQVMIEKGVKFIHGVPAGFEQIEETTDTKPGLIRVYYNEASEEGIMNKVSTDFNTVIMAIGRDALTDDLNLDKVGVERNKSGKVIGRHEQSTCPYVYAVGDVLEGAPELTPVAIQAGCVLMRRIFTGNMELMEYDNIPTTVFTPLEYGCCGLSEDKAVERYGNSNLNIYHSLFVPLEYTLPDRSEKKHCYCKLICLKDEKDLVLGYHILAPNAGEIAQGFAIGLKLHATKADFDRLIGIHPTVAENFTWLKIIKTENQTLKATDC